MVFVLLCAAIGSHPHNAAEVSGAERVEPVISRLFFDYSARSANIEVLHLRESSSPTRGRSNREGRYSED
jgi:hypothetical protein